MFQLITIQSLMCVMLCHATLGYNVLCRYTKHADLFEPDLCAKEEHFV